MDQGRARARRQSHRRTGQSQFRYPGPERHGHRAGRAPTPGSTRDRRYSTCRTGLMETVAVRERLRMTTNESGGAEVVLDRPPANAIDLLTLTELKQAAENLSVDRSVRAVLL